MSTPTDASAPPRTRRAAAHWIAVGIVLAGVLLVVLAHWPGRLDGDSLATIREVRSGVIADQRSVVMTWIWRQAYRLVDLGPGPVLALQTLVLAGGLYLLLRSAFAWLGAALVTVLLLFAPPVFGFVGLVGRDLWFSSCCLLAAGFVVASVRWSGRWRTAAIVAGACAAAVAVAARQNGATAALPLLVALAVPAVGLLAARRSGRAADLARRRPALSAVGLGLAVTLLIFGATTVAASMMRDRTVHPQLHTQLYDLGYLTVHEDERFIRGIPRAMQPVQTPDEMTDRWLPTTSIFMRWDPALNFAPGSNPAPYDARSAARLDDAWRDALEEHPLSYLEGRFGLWKHQIGIGHTPWYSMVVENQPNPWGYDEPALEGLSDLAVDYATVWAAQPGSLTGGTVHHVWIYLLACVAGLALLMPRFASPVRMVGALAAAGLGVQIGLFFLAPSVQLRYQLLAVYAGLVVACVGVRVAVGAAAARHRRANRPAEG